MNMNINKVEKEVLIQKKIGEGKSYDDADFEIERDKAFMYNVKYDFKELTKKNKKLKKDNERLIKLLNKNIVPKEKEIKEKKSKRDNWSCSVKHLKRILNNLNKKQITITQLSKDLIIKPDLIKEGLEFLAKYNLIKKVITNNGGRKYSK